MNTYFSKDMLLSLLLISFLSSCNLKDKENIITESDALQNQSLKENGKSFDFLPTSTTNQIIVHDNYTLSYVEKYEQAEWVAYELKQNEISNSNFDRPFFIDDNQVKTANLPCIIITPSP